MKVGFIGLGNVGGKLAGSIVRNGYDLTVRDLDKQAAQKFLDQGAHWADSPKEIAETCDVVITCLPSPAACSAVMEAEDGILAGLSAGKIWMEMSTTDEAEVKRIGALVKAKGADAIDCPVSGGCHRAATGNIAIFAGCERSAFEKGPSGPQGNGAENPAHRPDRIRFNFEGDDQLSGDRKSDYPVGSLGDVESRRYGYEHNL